LIVELFVNDGVKDFEDCKKVLHDLVPDAHDDFLKASLDEVRKKPLTHLTQCLKAVVKAQHKRLERKRDCKVCESARDACQKHAKECKGNERKQAETINEQQQDIDALQQDLESLEQKNGELDKTLNVLYEQVKNSLGSCGEQDKLRQDKSNLEEEMKTLKGSALKLTKVLISEHAGCASVVLGGALLSAFVLGHIVAKCIAVQPENK
jgi:predicted RNase H-like nuclease (RuvC/YqgF family)